MEKFMLATSILNQIVSGLDDLSSETMRIVSEDRTFMEIWGWNMPAMNRHEFSAFILSPVENIRKLLTADFTEQDVNSLSSIPNSLAYIRQNVIGNLPSGNAFHVYIVIDSLISKIHYILGKYVGGTVTLEEIEQKNLFPPAMIKEMRNLRGRLETAKNGIDKIDDELKTIKAGSEMINTLPVELENLRNARDGFNATQLILSENISATETARSEAEKRLQALVGIEQQAAKLLEDIQAANSATTSIGLGREFADRAQLLSKSVWWLTLALLVVLIVAGYISYQRIGAIHDVVEIKPLNMGLVWANVVAMIVSVGAPVWMAWLITRQIGQRFRLAEDYGFKASVAKAYSGYREEAGRLQDLDLEKQLFATTIRRIEEEPLRHIEKDNESTPLQSALRHLPSLKGVEANQLIAALIGALVKKDAKE
jgi:hypothetical protein